MGEIDHAAEIQDQRQAERHQRIEGADDQAVEQIEEDELRHAVIRLSCKRSAQALNFLSVAPAKAGTQGHSAHRLPWIPAFAGMTTGGSDPGAAAFAAPGRCSMLRPAI